MAGDTLKRIELCRRKAVKKIPSEWLSKVRMDRVICHWTAGRHKASGLDRAHYHILIEGDGNVVKGDFAISANSLFGA